MRKRSDMRSAKRGKGAAIQPSHSEPSYEDSQVASYDSYARRKQVTFESQNIFARPDPNEPYEVAPQYSFADDGRPWDSQPEHPQHYIRRPSRRGTMDSYSSSDSDYPPDTICIDPSLIQGGGQFQTCLPGMSEVDSPGGLTSAASSPALFNYYNNSPAQTAGYAIDQGDGYFAGSPNYRQYPVSKVVSPGGLTGAASSPAIFNYHNNSPAQTAGCAIGQSDGYSAGSPSYRQYPVSEVVHPGGLTGAASSPALFNSHNNSPAQTTGYAIDQGDGYFVGSSNYQQCPVVQERPQPASDLQERGPFPGGDSSKFASPSTPPDQPTYQDRKRDTADDCPLPDPKRCPTCRAGRMRPTDFERHLRTAKVHNVKPNGPACPGGCKYPEKFTRSDNFKAHYKKQHGVSDEEADKFIADWKARVALGSK